MKNFYSKRLEQAYKFKYKFRSPLRENHPWYRTVFSNSIIDGGSSYPADNVPEGTSDQLIRASPTPSLPTNCH